MRKVFLLLTFVLISSIFATWLSYCSDTPHNAYGPSYVFGVRFTPPATQGLISIVRVYCSASLEGYWDLGNPSLKISIWHVEDGVPTTMMSQWQYSFSEVNPSWRDFQINYQWSGDGETEFLAGVEPMHTMCGSGSWWNSAVWVDDQLDYPDRSWASGPAAWQTLNGYGDLMIRVSFCPGVGVQAESLGRVKSLFR
jgi:hypothetical protein